MSFALPLAAAVSLANPQSPPPLLAEPVAPTLALAGAAQDAGVEAQPQEPAPLPPLEGQPVPPESEAPAEAVGDPIIVTGDRGPPPGDPLADINLESYEVVQALDAAVVEPAAEAYGEALPSVVRDGLHNLLVNLSEPVAALNFLLQLKPLRALETIGRFAINSTIGIAGLIDVAKEEPFNLPHRNNGLANTLGYYGVGPGPYLYLPLMGATTVRDLAGRIVDISILPYAIGKPLAHPLVALTRGTLSSLDERLREADTIEALQQAPDPYTATKEWYLEKRQAEIDALKGKAPEPEEPANIP